MNLSMSVSGSPKLRKFALTTFITALALAGCGRSNPGDSEHAHTDEAEPGVSFSARYGLLVSPATASHIGLEVADVTERRVTAALNFGAQLYHTASDIQPASTPTHDTATMTALASGSVSTIQAAWLRVGQPVTATLFGTNPMPGRIAAMNHDLEKANGQVEIIVALAEPDGQGRSPKGVFLSVSVPLGGDKAVVSIPRSALLRTTEGDFVYTVSGEHFVRTPVKLGVVNREYAEVTEGLFEGDKIVVQPVTTLWLAELQSIRGGKACADGH